MQKKIWMILLIIIALQCCSTVYAYESWANVFGGWLDDDWFNSNNWTQATIPDYNDGSSGYSVTSIDGGVTCIISADEDASFYKMRIPYNVSTTIGVGTSTLILEPGTTLSGRSYIDMAFGPGDNAIIDANQANIDIISELKCGYRGDSTIDLVDSSMTVGSYVHVGRHLDSNAVINITDSVFNVPTRYMTLGVYDSNSTGHLNIVGASSELNVEEYMTIGQSGKGFLSLSDGIVDVNGSVSISTGGEGHLDIISGTFNSKDMNLGPRGEIYINDGTLNVDGRLRIWGSPDANIDIHGGTVNCNTFLLVHPQMDIDNAGTLIVDGDIVNQIKTYIDDGWITGGGIDRKVAVSYDSVSETTTVSLGTNDLVKMAYDPVPQRDAINIAKDATLSWSAGDGAVSHSLYLGTDYNDVANGTEGPVYQGTAASYTPGIKFASGTTYYWKVDEYDGSTTTAGEVWTFETSGFMSIDNFDDYATTEDMLLNWTENAGADANLVAGGSVTDNNLEIVYDNTISPYYAEVSRTVPFADFTQADMKALDIWYRGDSANTAASIYVTLNDGANSATVVTDNAEATKANNTTWQIALSDFTDANPALDLTSIDTITIGIGNKINPVASGSGTVLFDDIVLWEKRCFDPPAGDLNGDCIIDFQDFAVIASGWLTDNAWPQD